MALIVGLALGTDQGKELLISFLISESLQDMQSKYPPISPKEQSKNKVTSKLESQNPITPADQSDQNRKSADSVGIQEKSKISTPPPS